MYVKIDKRTLQRLSKPLRINSNIVAVRVVIPSSS